MSRIDRPVFQLPGYGFRGVKDSGDDHFLGDPWCGGWGRCEGTRYFYRRHVVRQVGVLPGPPTTSRWETGTALTPTRRKPELQWDNSSSTDGVTVEDR